MACKALSKRNEEPTKASSPWASVMHRHFLYQICVLSLLFWDMFRHMQAYERWINGENVTDILVYLFSKFRPPNLLSFSVKV